MLDRTTRLENAVKVAIECVFATLLIEWVHMPMGGIAVITVLILNTVYYKQTLTKGLQRFAGAVVCSVISILMISWFINLPVLYFLSMVFWLSVVFYLFRCNVQSYAMLIGGITTALLMTSALDNPQQAILTAFHWSICVGIGTLTVWFFDVFWPTYRAKTIEQEIISLIHQQQTDPMEYQRVINIIEACHSPAEDHMIRLVVLLKRYFMFVNSYHRQDIIQPLSKQSIAQLVAAINKKEPITHISYYAERHNELLRYRLHQLRKSKKISPLAHANSYPTILASIDQLDHMIWALNNINESANHWFKTERTDTDNAVKNKNTHILQLKPDALKQSSKMTLGILVMLFFEQYLGWPSGVQGIIAVTVLTGTPNLGRAHWKFYSRIAGVLAGSIIGLLALIVLNHYPSMLFVISIVYFVMGLAAYIALGSEKNSYFGVQMGVMIPLVLLMYGGPTADMTVPIDRFMGAVLGAAVAAFILYFIWPVDPKRMLINSLKQALSTGSNLFSSWHSGYRENMATCVKAIEQNDRAMIVDAQFLMDQSKHQQQHHTELSDLLNDFAQHAYLLTKALQAMDDTLYQRVTQALTPTLSQAANNMELLQKRFEEKTPVSNLQYQSITQPLEKLTRRIRRQKITRRLKDNDLITIGSVQRSVTALSHTMDQIASHLYHIRGADAPVMSLAMDGAEG